jgi:hypothetical protein
MKQAKASEREPGVNEITKINYQAGEQIRQMQQQQQQQKARQFGELEKTAGQQ